MRAGRARGTWDTRARTARNLAESQNHNHNYINVVKWTSRMEKCSRLIKGTVKFDKIQEMFLARAHVYSKVLDTNCQEKTSNFLAEAFRLRLLGFI